MNNVIRRIVFILSLVFAALFMSYGIFAARQTLSYIWVYAENEQIPFGQVVTGVADACGVSIGFSLLFLVSAGIVLITPKGGRA